METRYRIALLVCIIIYLLGMLILFLHASAMNIDATLAYSIERRVYGLLNISWNLTMLSLATFIILMAN